MVKVSIILISWSPTKYRLNLLKQTLDSLYKSTEIPFELILVDNGSKEQTNFLKTQKIDKHIINEKNLGIGFARNQGIEVAEGDYICFADNDLLFVKDWLKDSIEIIEKYPNEKLIINPILSLDSIERRKRYFLGMFDEYPIWQRAGATCLIARRNIINDIGKWSLGTTPGRDYTQRASMKGCKFISTIKKMVFHVGRRKSYDYTKKLINGEWVDHGREYWDKRWSNGFAQKYITGHKRLHNGIKPYLKGAIADLACGVTSLYINGDYDVTGVDVSSVAIEESRKLYPKGYFVVRTIEHTLLHSDSYDTVVLSEIIEHYGDFKNILLEAKRICKIGGNIIITVPIKNFDKDHVYPVWNEEKIKNEITPILGDIVYHKIAGKWWLIKYEKT